MKPIFKFWVIMFAFSVLFGCKKKSGCTDTYAPNYYEKAKIDDGSCLYEADMKFWVQENTWFNFQSSGVTSLTVFISNTEIGTLPSSATYLAAPLCVNTDLLECTRVFSSLEASKSANISYTVKDQNNAVVSSGSVAVTNIGCHIEEIQ